MAGLGYDQSRRREGTSNPAKGTMYPHAAATLACMKLSTSDLIDQFKTMTLAEVTEFRRQFEDTFDVTADAPQIVPDTLSVVAEVEPQTEFTVTLEAHGQKKIEVIKTVREITKLGLKEAKDFVDSAPKVLLQGVTKDAADDVAARLRGVGAEVSVT